MEWQAETHCNKCFALKLQANGASYCSPWKQQTGKNSLKHGTREMTIDGNDVPQVTCEGAAKNAASSSSPNTNAVLTAENENCASQQSFMSVRELESLFQLPPANRFLVSKRWKVTIRQVKTELQI